VSRKGRSRGICVECNRDMVMYRRGLCTTCYDRAKTSGRLGEYAPLHVDRRGTVADLVDQGHVTPKAIAERLGITRNAAFMALKKLRVEGYGNPTVAPTAPWAIPIPTPPTETPCAGVTMDSDGLLPKELHPDRNPDIRNGLTLCAACPLATRQWCLDVMDPRGLGKEWQGIAGGVVWSHGRVVYFEPGALEAPA